jgi:hypothetical protein
VCSADASVDDGSYDPEGEEITLVQAPPGPYSQGDTEVTLTVTNDKGISSECSAIITVEDQEPPEIQVFVPNVANSLQDTVTFAATASDNCVEVSQVFFSIREQNGTVVTPVNQEDLPAVYNTATERWEYDFDTTQLPDGNYVLLAIATDASGNESVTETQPFSIRNWAVVELLPSCDKNKAGRTMPVKFALRIAFAVDPSQPFVFNQQLEIRICENGNPDNVYQTCTYGDRSLDYRIGENQYITNFKTMKFPAEYEVRIYRLSKDFLVGRFTFSTTK